MKKGMSIVLVLILCLSLMACGKNDEAKTSSDTTSDTETEVKTSESSVSSTPVVSSPHADINEEGQVILEDPDGAPQEVHHQSQYFMQTVPGDEGLTNELVLHIEPSVHFSEEDLMAAVEAIKEGFKHHIGCSLLDLYYSDEVSESEKEVYMTNGRGAIHEGLDPANVIVFYSCFYVDGSGRNPVLSEGLIPGYNWILIRDDAQSPWVIDDKGF